MATVTSIGPGPYTLATALTGNTSSDTLDRGAHRGPVAVVVTSTVGADPTTKLDIEVSANGSQWWNGGYSLVATPETVAVAQITITTATTVTYLMRPSHPWRYLRLTLSTNTNVTVAAVTVI